MVKTILLEHASSKEDSWDVIAEWNGEYWVILRRYGDVDEVLGSIYNAKLIDQPHEWRSWLKKVK